MGASADADSHRAGLSLNFFAPVMVIACMDYSEWKTGERVEGAFYAVNGFASKVGAGLCSVVIGFLMGAAGFDSTLAVQPDSDLAAITALFSWIPAGMYVVIIVLMSVYTLDKMHERSVRTWKQGIAGAEERQASICKNPMAKPCGRWH